MRTVLIVVAASLLLGSSIHAQDTPQNPPSLKVPTFVFAGAAAADWTTTYVSARRGNRERNPLLSGLSRHPVALVITGAAIDVGSVWAWNRYVGKRHRKIATIGLYIASGFRVWLAARNMQRRCWGVDWTGPSPVTYRTPCQS